MPEIVDLDVLVPDPKRVKLGGVEYRVPADMPMEIFLRLNKVGDIRDEDGETDQIAQTEALIDIITELFVWEMPDATDEVTAEVREKVSTVLRRRSVKHTFELVRNVYRADDEADAEADPTVIDTQAHEVVD